MVIRHKKFALFIIFFLFFRSPAFSFAETFDSPKSEVFSYEYIDTKVTVNRSGDFNIVRKFKFLPQEKACNCSRSYYLDTDTFGEIKNIQVNDATTNKNLIYVPYQKESLDSAELSSQGKFTYYETPVRKNRHTFFYIKWFFSPKDALHEWQISFTVNGIVKFNNAGDLAHWHVFFDDYPANLLKVKVVFPEGILYDTINPILYRGIAGVPAPEDFFAIKPTIAENRKAVEFEAKQVASDERLTLALGIAPGVIVQETAGLNSSAKKTTNKEPSTGLNKIIDELSIFFHFDTKNGLDWGQIFFVLLVTGGMVGGIFFKRKYITSGNISQADRLMSQGKRDESKNLITDILQKAGTDAGTYEDAVLIFMMGNMYAEAKNVFELYRQKTGKILTTELLLEQILKKEIDANFAIENKVFHTSAEYSSASYFFNKIFNLEINEVRLNDDAVIFVKGRDLKKVMWADIISAEIRRFTTYEKGAGTNDNCWVIIKTQNKKYGLDLSPKNPQFEQYHVLMNELQKHLTFREDYGYAVRSKIIIFVAIFGGMAIVAVGLRYPRLLQDIISKIFKY